MKEGLIEQLKTMEKFFLNTVSCFAEEDSSFKPHDEVFTVAQQVGHVAETIPWFFEGVFGSGFDMNFEDYPEKMKKYVSFDACIADFKKNIANGIELVNAHSVEEWMAPIEGEVMKGAPKMASIGAIADHTAHHRGSLAVYARLAGKTPKMPYMD